MTDPSIDPLLAQLAATGLPPAELRNCSPEDLAAAYRRLGPENRVRHHLLAALAEGDAAALAQFAELIATDPPRRTEEVLPAFAPLFRRRDLDEKALFPRLLEGLEAPVVAAAILDLANHLTRRGGLAAHPAAERTAALAGLLSAVTQRLAMLQEQAANDAAKPAETTPAAREEAARQVSDSTALCVALCDALALIGDRSVAGKIRPVLDLAHRRLRTEAAWALARLRADEGEDDEGVDALVQLTAEPIARLRAIHYLEELGLSDRIPAEQATPLARAEAELGCWLAEPAQFGFPPQRLELVDQRRLYWPGYDEPQECFLLRYVYPLRQAEVTGIGLAGPATFAVRCDLEDMGPEDILALYAGSQVEHGEIGLEHGDEIPTATRRRAEGDLTAAAGNDYEKLELVAVGRFFDDRFPVAAALRGGRPGTAIVEEGRPHWYSAGNDRRPLGPTEAWWLHIGRKLLRTFNAEGEGSP
ncbi:MAG: hypothetical protein K8T25_08765 [Planctomycetia bacterium]|nr:hypothetical protein [Planctomycetia bacterium]